MEQITKKLNEQVFAWDPTAFGKGYWYVLGKKGGLGRAASKVEAKELGVPEGENEKQITEDKVNKTKGISSLLNNEKTNSKKPKVKKTISEKIKKIITRNTLSYNEKSKRDQETFLPGTSLSTDISSIGDSLFNKLYPVEDKKTSTLEKKNKTRKEPFITTVSSGKSSNVRKGDSVADVMVKLYNLTKKNYDDDKKKSQRTKNFSKERGDEKKKFLDDLLKGIGGTDKKQIKKSKKEEESTSILTGFITSLGSSAGKLLGMLSGFLMSPFAIAFLGVTSFAVLSSILSDYAKDWAKTVPDMKQRTPKAIAAVLENGSERDKLKQAEDVSGQKPKDLDEALDVLEKYVREAPEESKQYIDLYDSSKENLELLKTEYENAKKKNNPEEINSIRSELDKAQVEFRNLEIKVADKGGIGLLRQIVKEGKQVVPERKPKSESATTWPPRPIVSEGVKKASQQAAADEWDKKYPGKDPAGNPPLRVEEEPKDTSTSLKARRTTLEPKPTGNGMMGEPPKREPGWEADFHGTEPDNSYIDVSAESVDTDSPNLMPDTAANIVPMSDVGNGQRLEKMSAEYNYNEKLTGGNNTYIVDSSSRTILNSGGSNVFVETQTGVRTDERSKERIQRQNFRWV